MNDTNRRFANELAAFKNGENVDHKNLETIVVPERSKSSFVKLSLILIILSALGYYFIKKPIRNKQIQSAVIKSEMNALTLEVYEQELAKIDGTFSENREFVQKLYESNVSLELLKNLKAAAISGINQADFYLKLNTLIGKDSLYDLSSISLFLQHFSVDTFMQVVESTADINYINKLKHDPRFSNFDTNDLVNLALVDKNKIVLKLPIVAKTQLFTLTEWIQIAENFDESTYITNVIIADKKNELSVEQLLILNEKEIPLNDVIFALEKGNISEQLKIWANQ